MKKLLAIVLSILMFASLAISASASIVGRESLHGLYRDDNFTLGDVDNDGAVNARDLLSFKAHISNVDKGLDFNADAADIDADAKVNTRDMLYIKASIVGKVNLADYDSDAQIDSFTIAGNPISDYEIVLDDDFVVNNDNVTAAVKMLKAYVYNATGVALNDVKGEASLTAPHMIRMVRMEPTAPAEDRMSLGYEDYVYEVKNGDLYIYGTLRGNLYAVYEIAEDIMGFRFVNNALLYEYEKRAVDIPEGTNVRHETRLEFRYNGQYDGNDTQLYTYYMANRLNGTQTWRGGGRDVGYFTGPLFDNAHSFLSNLQIAKGYYYLLAQGHSEEEVLSNLWNAWSAGARFAKTWDWQPCASDYQAIEFVENGEKGEYIGSDYAFMVKGLFLMQELKKNEDSYKRLDLGVLKATFSHCDNTNGCQCKICKAKYTGGTIYGRTESAVMMHVDGYGGSYTYTYDAKQTSAKRHQVTFEKESFTGAYLDMINRAVREFQEVYENAEVWTIIYDHVIPATVRPGKNVSIMYCGHECLQHALGTGECGDDLTVLGSNNNHDEEIMGWWADTVHAEGGHIWFWSYGISYNYYFSPCPDIDEFWVNFDFIMNKCNFDGAYYEGCGCYYNFEGLKSYLVNQLMWNPDMTQEEYYDMIREYLKIYYGDDKGYLFEYIQLQQAAGDATGHCFVTNHDRPWDFFDWKYLADHYDEMRTLLENAYANASNDRQREAVQFLIYSCDFMGISSAWDVLYLNGTAETRSMCEDRLTALYNFFDTTGLAICGAYHLPDELSFDECPMNLFFDDGAWRIENIPAFAR